MENAGPFWIIGICAFAFVILIVKLKSQNQIQQQNAVMILVNASDETIEKKILYLRAISGKQISSHIAQLAFDKSLSILSQHIDNEQVRGYFYHYITSSFPLSQARQFCYGAVLSVLLKCEIIMTPEIKMFVLAVARWSYAGNRSNGVLTIYDEQAIQNDLATLIKS